VSSLSLGRDYQRPGVYVQPTFGRPAATEFRTGVPIFFGYTSKRPEPGPYERTDSPRLLTALRQFTEFFGPPVTGGYLAAAVRGFFENGGEQCYVVPVPSLDLKTLANALSDTSSLHSADLICVPDVVGAPPAHPSSGASGTPLPLHDVAGLYEVIVQHCFDTGGRFALLDTPQHATWEQAWEQWWQTDGVDGAIYYPWIRVRAEDGTLRAVPPCGHIAGVYARTDRARGVHKAPANEVLRGVFELDREVSASLQDFLNPKGINCLRSFPGRGIRVWGARTVSGLGPWRYVPTRRVFTTAVRWLRVSAPVVAFEPNDQSLWSRIERELTSYFLDQFRRGALKGRTPRESFYVRCDASTNPPELRDSGQIVAEIGLATAVPFEFVVVRLSQGLTSTTITGPFAPTETIQGE
jgi:uncharacterized protein